MSSTASAICVSNLHSTILTERCGEVYCSLNLKTYFINCLRCSEEFDLLSCNLFIEHIQKCFHAVYQDQVQESSVQKSPDHEVSSIKDDCKEAEFTIQQIDPLTTAVKQEDIRGDEESTIKEAPNEDVESDYQAEDDLPLEKLGRRKIVEGIINEYKKYPILWNTTLTVKRADKIRAYRKIRKAVNSKYKTNYSYIELRTQIQNLRCGYQRVLRKKKVFDQLYPDGAKQFNPMLWFFEKISFIGGSNQDYKVDLTQNSETEQDDRNEFSDSSLDRSMNESKKSKPKPNSKVLAEKDVIADIISQYKQYPLLWDQTCPLYCDRYARKDAIRKITKFINQKFNKNATDKDVKKQISNLRCVYRKVQREKHKPNYQLNLWYFNDLSFIDNKSNNEPGKIVDDNINPDNSMDCGEKYEITEEQNMNEYDHDEDQNDPDDLNNDPVSLLSCRRRNNKLILSLIEEYKKHPCLWDHTQQKTAVRYDAIEEITFALNTKYNANFNKMDIRNKIMQLRSSYRRVLRNKEAFEKKHANAKRKFLPQLWYFDKFTFIGTKESDFAWNRKKNKKGDPLDDDEDEEFHSDCPSEETQERHNTDEQMSIESDPTITGNKPLLTAIVKEYKKRPSLWKVQSNQGIRQRDLNEICDKMNQRFGTTLECETLENEMDAIISSYKEMLRKDNSEEESKVWYADLLSFVSALDDSEPNESCDKSEEQSGPPEESVNVGNYCSGDEELCQSGTPVNTKETVFKLIELYREAAVLWNMDHPRYTMRTERKKAIESILSTLSQENDCKLTVEEFRYQIRFLKKYYFRAVRQEIMIKQANISPKHTVKPFFFKEMSFLEPYAIKASQTVPELQITKEQSENLSFLCENKSLMIEFIELYKANSCLWDQNHKDRNNPTAHALAYGQLIDMFAQHGVDLKEDQVRAAIALLHSTVVNTQRTLAQNETNITNESPVWFYEHLQFLERIPRIQEKFCTHCNQHFHSLAEYEKHKIDVAGDYPYKCEICNAGFVSRSKFAYHQITHKEPHKCDQCDFQAFDKHNFNVHMRRHKGIHMFRCDKCNKGFVTSTELNRHLRMHTGEKSYICEICGKALVANSEYHHHMKRHRNQRDHKCEICGSAFFTAKTLRGHMASHSSEREHVCEICGSAFKRKKTLHQHMALHTEKKKHECNICGKLFAQKAGVYSHMKSHGQIIGS